ncbi:FxsA family protein [Solibacillus sp. FSL H8-0538]|uniref:FxsA family protein n=1 Tax=Solibacillus sp. FSL H8-0538 TaxID=2921400 RepID=UPI0030F9F7E1
MKKIMLSFVLVLFAEIATFIIVGKAIGVFYTLLLIVLTSVFGVMIAKNKGMQSFQTIQTSIANGQAPGVAMIETFMIFVGGVLLVVPGFITDIIGLLMVTGITRNIFKPVIFFWLRKKMKNGQVVIVQR